MNKHRLLFSQVALGGLAGSALAVAVVALVRANRRSEVDIVVPWERLDAWTRQEVALTLREGRDTLNARLQRIINENIRSQRAATEGNIP